MNTKKHILALLESSRGKSVSGERIARQLNVSRNAVWKAINALKKDGYRINAVKNKGYCLCEDNDILSVQGMLPFLSCKEAFNSIFVHASLDSTNKTAKELAITGAGHGTVVIADRQTEGRGRYERTFYSPPGHGIYMSIILRPDRIRLETPALITAFAAVSVCEAIESVTNKTPQIKWVNDIYLDDKKICGILTEAVTDFETGNMQWIVVGIGINFSISAMNFPEELRHIAQSVFSDTNPPVTRNQLAAEIINRITIYDSPPERKKLLYEYKKRMIMMGERVYLMGARDTFEAIAVDIDDMGRLIVKKDNGEIIPVSAGEISIRK